MAIKTIDVSDLLESYQKTIAELEQKLSELDDENYRLRKARDAAIREIGKLATKCDRLRQQIKGD